MVIILLAGDIQATILQTRGENNIHAVIIMLTGDIQPAGEGASPDPPLPQNNPQHNITQIHNTEQKHKGQKSERKSLRGKMNAGKIMYMR